MGNSDNNIIELFMQIEKNSSFHMSEDCYTHYDKT